MQTTHSVQVQWNACHPFVNICSGGAALGFSIGLWNINRPTRPSGNCGPPGCAALLCDEFPVFTCRKPTTASGRSQNIVAPKGLIDSGIDSVCRMSAVEIS